ncbi:hypothetical protein [Segetibacter sp.]|jgi:hypothetical protein|uniref:hypothetical protein n=1 Tax=Segetibacter sp. TaxID=2231182 RepID=UPI00260E63F2|nr:hypothetical protein [Segetibacter sp.]MCW3082480.1 hypothetical protein [Segetibacter sp.]
MKKHPADIILDFILLKENLVGDSIISKETGINRNVVEYWIVEMERLKPAWIEVDTGYADNKLIVGVNSWHRFEIGQFLKLGGFTTLLQNQERGKDDEQKKRDKEIRDLHREIDSLKIKPWMVWASITLSVVAIIISLVALNK